MIRAATSLPLHGTDQSPPPHPPGHRGPRGAILLHLKDHGSATARDLAAALECSLNAARHHLKELEADGVIVFERVPHGVGAPAHRYRLSDLGHALFPQRYREALASLLDHLEASEGRATTVELLTAHYRALGNRMAEATADLPLHHRGPVIARLLDAEGYMATWQQDADGGVLTERNCPHQLMADRFPELCAAEEACLSHAFGVTVQRNSQMTGGCGTCRYRVTVPEPQGVPA